MARLVQKFGGAAVAGLERVSAVAEQIKKAWSNNHEVAVVVSAMKGETDRLVSLAQQVMQQPNSREYDVLVSSGEQVSVALLAMALNKIGVPACSLLGHQVRIRTDSSHARAKILSVDTNRVKELLTVKKVPVIAGFQGIDAHEELTTLGRGGSDLTAVALAAALAAETCEVYKDVDGVFTADPLVCGDAALIETVSYEEMMELASSGAKVLQTRAVLFAKNSGVSIHVKSCFNWDRPGTQVVSEDKLMEKAVVSAVTIDKNEAKIGIDRLPDKPGVAAKLFSALTEKEIFVDMIVQNVSSEGNCALAFTVPKDQVEEAYAIVKQLCQEHGWGGVLKDEKVAKVSAIGVGMRTHSGVASQMFQALAEEGINITMIGTSEIRISCLIEEKYAELALRTLHEAFRLGQPNPNKS